MFWFFLMEYPRAHKIPGFKGGDLFGGGRPHAHKIPGFKGGGFGIVLGGGRQECKFYFYGRVFFF